MPVKPFHELPLQVQLARQRIDIDGLSRGERVGRHRHAVAGDDDLVGSGKSLFIVVFAAAKHMQPMRRLDGLCQQVGNDLIRAGACYHDQRAATLLRIPMNLRHHVPRCRTIENIGKARTAGEQGNDGPPRPVIACQAAPFEFHSRQRHRQLDDIRGRSQAVLRRGDDEIECRWRAGGPADADGLDGAVGFGFQPPRDDAGQSLGAEDEIGPGRNQRFRRRLHQQLGKRRDAGRSKRQFLDFITPAQGLNQTQHLVEVALAPAPQDPDQRFSAHALPAEPDDSFPANRTRSFPSYIPAPAGAPLGPSSGAIHCPQPTTRGDPRDLLHPGR